MSIASNVRGVGWALCRFSIVASRRRVDECLDRLAHLFGDNRDARKRCKDFGTCKVNSNEHKRM